MSKGIRSVALRYGLALLSFALLLLLSFSLQRFFSFRLDTTPFIIALLVASAWYGGRGPGLLIAILFELTLDYFSRSPLSFQVLAIVFNRLFLFASLALFASSRRSAEKRLQQQSEWLRVALSSIGDAVIATDINGLINFINPTAEALTGWSRADAANKPLADVFNIINETTRQPVDNPVTKVLREGAIVGLANHTVLLSREGREIPIDDSGAPIRLPGGKIIGVVLVFRDIAERKQAEKEREELLARERIARKDAEQSSSLSAELLIREQAARKQAEEASRMKDDFLATVSHELRTPLNAILGWSVILRRNPADADTAAQAIETIERNARAQTQLIEDLLDVSRIITGRMRLDVQPVEVPLVIQATVDAIRPAAEAKEIGLQVVLDSRVGPVSCDPGRLQQIIWNLLSNAVKFTPKGGRVEIRFEQIDSHVEITVSDTGKGISPEFIPYVFDRFRQGDSSFNRVHGGLGLGLSIVRQLAELHGGTVEAGSVGEGQGATFRVKLPVAIGRDGARSSAAALEPEETESTFSPPKKA